MDQVFRMHLTQSLPRASEQVDSPLEERADEIIARATAKDPGQRHGDVAGFMPQGQDHAVAVQGHVHGLAGCRRTQQGQEGERDCR
jgi:hypothetical protein